MHRDGPPEEPFRSASPLKMERCSNVGGESADTVESVARKAMPAMMLPAAALVDEEFAETREVLQRLYQIVVDLQVHPTRQA